MSKPMPRFVVHDEDGPIRAFYTRAAAQAWMSEGMRLVVLPKEAKPDPYILAMTVGIAIV